MWTYYPDLLERAVPRYTSYPTAADFNDISADGYAAALGKVGAYDPISLYVHIPFCEQICWYCGCNTAKSNKIERLNSYMKALVQEIDLVSRKLGGRGKIARIAFGGGSPNALSAVQFARLMDIMTLAFRFADPVMSIEIDPRSFGEEWVKVIRSAGITHASLGVQTLEPSLQAAIGRVQPSELIERSTMFLRQAGVTSLNFDFMYGLPGQTADMLAATLDEAIAMKPDRIALFGYAHVPSIIPRQRQIDASALPDNPARFEMASKGYEQLVAAGYIPVGFDHFALPSDPLAHLAAQSKVRRNFQGFTDDQSDILIGLGASAISCFPDGIFQNEKNSGLYRKLVADDCLPVTRGVNRCDQDQICGKIIESLLCNNIADLAPLGNMLPYVAALNPFIYRGLAEMQGSRLCLKPDARPYARSIAATFDEFRNHSSGTFSQAV